MKSLLSCVALFLLLAATNSYADIARPKPSAAKQGKLVLHTSLEIIPDAKASEARLQIRQSDLQDLRAALEGAPRNGTLAASIFHSDSRTIIAGILLFISLSCAGVWLARSSRSDSRFGRSQKAAAVILLAAATLGAASIITRGNAGPPGSYRWRNLPKALAKGQTTAGGVDIEIVPDDAAGGTGFRLIVPLRNQGNPGEDE
jgi:hypothetical protein